MRLITDKHPASCMKRKTKYIPLRIAFIIIGSLLLFFCSRNLYIASPVEESDLFRIDSLVLQSRAYGHPKAGGFDLTTADGFKLFLRSQYYFGVEDKGELLNTLMYHGTVFSIYTDQEGIENYRAGRTENSIDIYRFIIGTKEYTNLAVSNERIVLNTYLASILGIIFGFVFIYCGAKKQL